MSIFTMRRFWIAVSLPAFVALIAGKNWLAITSVVWLPLSLALLLWAFFTYRRDRKEAEAAKANLQNRQKLEINRPNFDLFGENYTFVKSLSGTVIDTNSQKGSIWLKKIRGMRSSLKNMEFHSEFLTAFVFTISCSKMKMEHVDHLAMHLLLTKALVNMK